MDAQAPLIVELRDAAAPTGGGAGGGGGPTAAAGRQAPSVRALERVQLCGRDAAVRGDNSAQPRRTRRSTCTTRRCCTRRRRANDCQRPRPRLAVQYSTAQYRTPL